MQQFLPDAGTALALTLGVYLMTLVLTFKRRELLEAPVTNGSVLVLTLLLLLGITVPLLSILGYVAQLAAKTK